MESDGISPPSDNVSKLLEVVNPWPLWRCSLKRMVLKKSKRDCAHPQQAITSPGHMESHKINPPPPPLTASIHTKLIENL